MGLKSIATFVTDDSSDRHALRAAADCAQLFDAHLDVYCVGVDATRYDAMPAGAMVVVDQGQQEATATADKLQAWVTDETSGQSSIAVERSVSPMLALERHCAHRARYADLVISGRPYEEHRSPAAASICEAALFGAHCPVLTVPEDFTVQQPQAITIAWNESDEALGAVRRALPLLHAAQRVNVVAINPPARSPERSDPGGALALWLSRHGISSQVHVLSKTLPRVSDVIMRFITDHENDMLVMGAYGHSRFREALIGGATRDLLEECPVPVFLAH